LLALLGGKEEPFKLNLPCFIRAYRTDEIAKSLESFFQGQNRNCLQNLSRYEANIEKNFYKALHQLRAEES
jgi:hypothetical protein